MKPITVFRTIAFLSLLESSLAQHNDSIINEAKFIFAFGDSYTREGYSGNGSPLTPHAMTCSTAGPNWARQLVNIVNQVNRTVITGVTSTQLINLAVSGTTVDNRIVVGAAPDFVNQTTTFLQFLTQDKVSWTKDNAIFTVTFGTNDVNNSFKNATADLYIRDMESYFASVERLYGAGARQFLFNNVVPFDQALTGIVLGKTLQRRLGDSIEQFNKDLSQQADTWCRSKPDAKCSIFDTHSLVSTILENFRDFGFATPNQVCASYDHFGGCDILPTIDPTCLGPVSAYVWKNALHPSWATDSLWAHALFNQLSAIN